MIVVSRYTEDGNYPALAAKLKASCERFGLRYDILAVPSQGTWRETEQLKPSWIFSKLVEAREAIAWIDADCEVIRLPSLLFGPSADFATYNWCADPETDPSFGYDPHKLKVSGGVQLFGYTAPAIELVARWSAEELRPDDISSDQTLERVYNEHTPPVRALWLPKSYNRMDSLWPTVEPVINHVFKAGSHKAGESWLKQ